MKNINEQISAYIDGELTPSETSELEQKIALSKDLQIKLAELKKVKELARISVKELEASPYFETRLMAEISKNKSSAGLKRWMPVFGVIIFTAALMITLKYNPGIIDNLVKEQEQNIAGFYKENLKPLLITAGLSKEDIFNFAFYRQLPLDNSKRQYLKLGSSADGEEFFEIQTASIIDDEDNFEKFVKALNLNQEQKIKMDSILEAYAEEMQGQVLVNENNIVAINPNLWNYNKAIFAEIMSFAEEANKDAFTKVIPAGYTFYDKPTVHKIVHEIKSKKDNNYIFFSPDTIFSEEFVFDKEKFRKDMEEMKKRFHEDGKKFEKKMKNFSFKFDMDSTFLKLKNDPSWNKNFKVYIDSNSFTVHLSEFQIPKINMPDFDSLAKHIEQATKNLNFTFRMPPLPKIDADIRLKIDSLNSYNFNFQIPDVDSIIDFHLRMNDSSFNFNGNRFNFRIDSLVSGFKMFGDSSFHFNQKEFQEGMKKFQQEMENFREEMHDFRRELRRDSIESENNEPIEI